MEKDTLAGKMFDIPIETDERVNQSLWDCLSCAVPETGFKIRLRELSTTPYVMRQCPSCKKVYICAEVRTR